MRHHARCRALLASLAVLAGCDATAPWTSAPGERLKREVKFSPSSLSFAGQVGFGRPASQMVEAVEGLGPGTWMDAETTGPVSLVGWGRTTFNVAVEAPEVLGPGDFAGLIRFRSRSGGEDLGSIAVRYVVTGPTLAPTPPELEFEQLVRGPPPPAQQIVLSGPAGDGPWTAVADNTYASPPFLDVSPAGGGTTPANLTAAVSGIPTLPGTSTARIVVTRRERQLSIPVRRIARGPVTTISSDPLVFSVRQYEALLSDLPRVTTTSEQDTPVRFWGQGSYNDVEPNATPWLSLPQLPFWGPGSFPVGLARTDLPVGRHTATLRIFDEWYVSDVSFPVVLDVGPALLAPSPTALSFEVGAATTAADSTAEVALSTSGPTVTWTASADVPWLAVTPASGASAAGTPSALTVEIVPAALPALPRGPSEGTVEVVTIDQAGIAVVRIPVTLFLTLPRIVDVGPAYDIVGNVAAVAVFGEDLYPAASVAFDDVIVPATWSYAKMTAVPPALSPGTHRVTIPTALGITAGAATYRIVAPAAFGDVAFDSPGAKVRTWFDDAEQALWAVNSGSGALERYRASTGWLREALPLGGLTDAAPLPGRDRVLTWSEAGALYVEAAALALSAAQPTDVTARAWSGVSGRLAVLHDGWAVFLETACPVCRGPCTVLDPDTQVVQTSYARSRGIRAVVTNRVADAFVGSTDGVDAQTPSGIYLGRRGWDGVPTSGPWYYVPHDTSQVATDRFARWLIAIRDGTSSAGDSFVGEWSDASGLVIRPGTLPSTIAAALLTQDGARAIAFDGVARTVRVFDLVSPPDGTTGLFLELGNAGGIAPAADPGGDVVLALSGDDRILFVSGDVRTAIVPLP